MAEQSPDWELVDLCSNAQSTTHELCHWGSCSAYVSLVFLLCRIKMIIPALYISYCTTIINWDNVYQHVSETINYNLYFVIRAAPIISFNYEITMNIQVSIQVIILYSLSHWEHKSWQDSIYHLQLADKFLNMWDTV